MKCMRVGDNKGFTIVETMIVLAVSGILFASVAVLISGKQQTATFQTSIRDIQAQVQQVINETASGYYPTSGFDCTIVGGRPKTVNRPVGSPQTQGNHYGCVFLGKVLHFSDGTHIAASGYQIYPLAGLQTATDNASSSSTLDQAKPAVVTQAISTNRLQGGLEVTSMKYVNQATHSTTAIGSVGFVQSFGPSSLSSQPATSGSQNLDLVVPLMGSSLRNDQDSEISAVENDFSTNNTPLKYADSSIVAGASVQICFKSGTTNQYGLITVGDSLNGLSVGLKIFDSSGCP